MTFIAEVHEAKDKSSPTHRIGWPDGNGSEEGWVRLRAGDEGEDNNILPLGYHLSLDFVTAV